jgi:hypothetical protein
MPTTSQTTKFIRSTNHVFAFAGDDMAEKIAGDLRSLLDVNPSADLSQGLLDVLNSFGRPAPIYSTILGIARGQLWLFSFGGNIIGGPTTKVIDDKYVAGSGNAAAFFSERYYDDMRGNTEALKKLAAHVICVGGRLNTQGVKGLEMMVWDRRTNTLSLVGGAEIQALRLWSEQLDKDIGRSIDA